VLIFVYTALAGVHGIGGYNEKWTRLVYESADRLPK
jgi:hypothetical protein